jgi:hypothetical protein
MYQDPLNIQCNYCKKYSERYISDLKEHDVCCKFCGENISYIWAEMEQHRKSHIINMWPSNFIFESFDAFDIDIDTVTEKDFDQINTLSDLVSYIVRNEKNVDIVEKYLLSLKIFECISNKKDIFTINLLDLAAVVLNENRLLNEQ